jgi:DNA-binding transcriptional MerR regulator
MLDARDEPYNQTTSTLARLACCEPQLVRDYANLQLIECIRLENGTRLFKSSAAARVREIRAERLARRGGRRTARPAA